MSDERAPNLGLAAQNEDANRLTDPISELYYQEVQRLRQELNELRDEEEARG